MANDMLVGEDGLLAVGVSEDWQRARLWRSVDGRSWEGFDLPGEQGSVTIAGTITRVDDLLVIVGIAETVADGTLTRHPVVWFSTDGELWEASEVEGSDEPGVVAMMSTPVQFGDLLAAVGNTGDAERWTAAVWLSSDGRSWSRVADNSSVFGGPDPSTTSMTSVVALDDRLVAVGCTGVARTMVTAGWATPRMWISADGATWIPLPLDQAAFAATPVACFTTIHRQGEQLFVLGGRDSGDAGSADGPSVLWEIPISDIVAVPLGSQ